MHVTTVELENIKSYGEGARRGLFSFERGTTAIVGPNGAGKTTILEAVAWALFDVLDYSKDDFLRRGAKRGSARVTFQDDVDERLYTVYRDTGSGYYVYDVELKQKIQQGKTDVRKWLDQHLGVEPGTDLKSLFRSAIGVPQGLFTTDFLQTPADRKKSFDRLLKVEEYREGAERLRDTSSLIGERIAEARGRISGAEAQLARYDTALEDHATARARAEELDELLARFRREAEESARAVEELDRAEALTTEARALADRSEVVRDSAAQRLRELQGALEAARAAAERQRATESDYRAHLEATERLRALETERTERERLREEASASARLVALAEADVRRLEDSLARARQARAALEEIEKDVTAQAEFERERERLRDLLAQARAAGERLSRLDAELGTLRRAHAETSRRVHAAENLSDAAARADKLESERMGVETRLSRIENALTSLKHLASRRREAEREADRLRRGVTTLEREAREFEQAATAAAGLAGLEENERELTNRAAALRAAINQDERASAKAKGGVCPILHEPCKNLAEEGRTFEDFFVEQLKSNRAKLSKVEREAERVARDVRAAREAEKAAARFDTTRARLAHDRELLAERESALSRIDEELATHADVSESVKDELQAEMIGIDGMLRAAREDALRYAELEPLRARLREIEEEGKSKKEEREQVAAAAGAEGPLTEDVSRVERNLRELGDPRSRAAALRAEAEREPEFSNELKGAGQALETLRAQSNALDKKLKKFSALDAAWAEATHARDRSSEGYREHIESGSLAKTLPARESEAVEAEALAARAASEAEASRAEYERALAAYDRERHASERTALALARERSAATGAQLEAAREREASLSTEVARLDEVRSSWKQEILTVDRLKELSAMTEFIRDTLKKAGPLVTESYLYNISVEANHLFREITGDGGLTLQWTNDYDIVLEEGGHRPRSFVSLSGGEQMVAALSVRLALLKQLSDIRVAFFDEPTVNMDAERRERLAQQIGQVRDFDQLFVISHDDTFEQTVDHVVPVAREAVEEVA